MMWFAIISEDFENSLPLRKQVRAEHLARLNELNQQSRLLLAGPNPLDEQNESAGFSGSLIIAQFNSLNDAKIWAEADPYIKMGVYQKVTVKPFKKVLP